jgi:predicted alpha/beta hydrolase family esterase
MTHELSAPVAPQFLIVPGLYDSGPTHWQSHWHRLLRNARRAELGNWSDPDPATWSKRLGRAVRQADAPVIIVAHSLGCHAFAHWVKNAERHDVSRISGALLVAPPDCGPDAANPVLRRFAPVPQLALPFPAILTASRNDPYATLVQSQRLAQLWSCRFIDSGEIGHINASSGIGHWPAGLAMLGRLISLAGFGRQDREFSRRTFAAQEVKAAA